MMKAKNFFHTKFKTIQCGIGALTLCLSNQVCHGQQVIDIFMVGNSYTLENPTLGTYYEMSGFVESANRLYGSQFDITFNLTEETFGGRRIFEHNQNISAAELSSGGYEHIILQEQSQLLAVAYASYATELDSGINFFEAFDRPYINPWTELDRTNAEVDQVYFGWHAMLNKIVNNSPNSTVHVFKHGAEHQALLVEATMSIYEEISSWLMIFMTKLSVED